MSSRPTLFDSIFKMLVSSAPETQPLPPDGKPDLPQQSIFGDGFAAIASENKDWPGPDGESLAATMHGLQERLGRIESLLERLVHQRTLKDWYTIAEAAEILGKADFTVREWCRLGRVRAQKRPCGRGRSREWMIARDELLRIQNEGLLPQPTISTRIR